MNELVTGTGFFLFGLLTGFGHCIGMCCPFVLWIAQGQRDADRRGWRRLLPHLAYNLGRTITYALLGTAAGLLGSAVQLGGSLLGLQRLTAIVVGGLLILYAGFALVGMLPLARIESLRFIERWVSRQLARPPRRPLVIGLVLGLLPCGPLYGALIAAAGLKSAAAGAGAMALFGLGTIPAMLGLGLAGELLLRARRVVFVLSLLVVLGMGLWFVWQGIRL
jgi:hypothetical protein